MNPLPAPVLAVFNHFWARTIAQYLELHWKANQSLTVKGSLTRLAIFLHFPSKQLHCLSEHVHMHNKIAADSMLDKKGRLSQVPSGLLARGTAKKLVYLLD